MLRRRPCGAQLRSAEKGGFRGQVAQHIEAERLSLHLMIPIRLQRLRHIRQPDMIRFPSQHLVIQLRQLGKVHFGGVNGNHFMHDVLLA